MLKTNARYGWARETSIYLKDMLVKVEDYRHHRWLPSRTVALRQILSAALRAEGYLL